jgi:glycosyltransferase involved in cell wall biosynthesis
VIDDGSRDDTYDVAKGTADVVLRFPRNRGKGAALRAGFSRALELEPGAVVTVDADGQHDPAYAPALVDALGAADLVIGARDRRSPAMPVRRRLTNALSAAAVGRCIRRPVADAQSGFRAMRPTILGSVVARGDRYEYETEFLILTARQGHRVSFVPVPTRYDVPVPSHFRSLRDSVRIVRTLWRFNAGMAY